MDTKKLLDSKWTAIDPRDKDKHFVVNRIFQLRTQGKKQVYVELEAVLSKRIRNSSLQELGDSNRWIRGWSRESHCDEVSTGGQPEPAASVLRVS